MPAAADLLNRPSRFGQPFSQHFFGRFSFGGVTAIFFAAGAGGPFPDHETAELRDAVPGFKEGFVETALKIEVNRRLGLRVIPRLLGRVLLAAPADFGEDDRLADLALETEDV